MIKTYTALTRNIDDPEEAVREICEQLNVEKNALKNTIGIMHFFHECAESGVCQAVEKALPFPLVGTVSTYTSVSGEYGEFVFAVTMITSDDTHFSIHNIENINTKPKQEIADEFLALCKEICSVEKPKMVMSFLSASNNFSADELVALTNKLPETLPFFGSVAFNIESVGTHYVASEGKVSSDMLTLVAFYGAVNPTFHVTTSFAFDDKFLDDAEITDADGTVIKTVNNQPVLQYLISQGLVSEDRTLADGSIWALPALLSYSDGTTVVRAFVGIDEENDYVFATGAMEVGARIKFSLMDAGKTLASAAEIVERLSNLEANDVIAYSCAARAWSLGTEIHAEAEKIAECAKVFEAKHGKPFVFSVVSSGGEICPVTDKDGKLVNVLHNYTLSACSLN